MKKNKFVIPVVLPIHIGIIMDGNGRWAKKRKLPRLAGHKEGVKSVRKIVRLCGEVNIKYLTLYTFSTENWKRSDREVSFLMNMMNNLIKSEVKELNKNNVKLKFIGNRKLLNNNMQIEINKAEKFTEKNTGLTLLLALSYGARDEIINAVKKIIDCYKANENINIDEESFKDFLYTKNIPDPDLIIRTSGEKRLSNFLIYQSAYSEIYFTEVLWPDFREDELFKALDDFSKRKRRFGKV